MADKNVSNQVWGIKQKIEAAEKERQEWANSVS
jgi:hypothetical protein